MIDRLYTEGRDPRRHGRLIGWLAIAVALALLNYAARAASKTSDPDVLYKWSSAIGALVQYGIMLALVLFVARGDDLAAALGWRRPASWGRAILLALGALVVIYAVSALLDHFLHASKEQGLTPNGWQSAHAAAFAANFVAIAVVAPFVEETLYRGLGVTATAAWGMLPAALVTGLAFGLGHGLVRGLPILAFFGFVLALVRWRTGSSYPGMLTHAAFNAIALIAAVTT